SQRVGLWLARKLDQSELEEICQTEYRALVEANQLSQFHTEFALTLEAPKTAGTISIANGSQTVQGLGTAFTATDVGRRLRVSSFDPAFEVVSVNVGLQQLGLDSPWVSDTIINQTYSLFKNIYALPNYIAFVFSMAGR